jgi:hypothetical protein
MNPHRCNCNEGDAGSPIKPLLGSAQEKPRQPKLTGRYEITTAHR